MERWLLISNCQTAGLANAFQMVNSNFHVTPVDIWSFKAQRDQWTDRLGDYYRVLVSPEVEAAAEGRLDQAPNLTRIPPIGFSAYQPDCTYAGGQSGMLKGPLDAYHSIIIIAAFNKGLSIKDAEALFCGEFYERIGYMDYWVPQRDRLVNEFAQYGFDISQDIRRWGRNEAWMHTIDHPKISVIEGVARAVMRSMGVPLLHTNLLPEDNLTRGASWAVYPEIGEQLGVPGSLKFKRFGQYTHIGLRDLIAAYYALYEKEPVGTVLPIPEARPAYQLVLEAI